MFHFAPHLPPVFFFTDTAPTEIYTLSLHDALPIFEAIDREPWDTAWERRRQPYGAGYGKSRGKSEEHTSELQSHVNLVCRLLLEKKKNKREVSQTGSGYNAMIQFLTVLIDLTLTSI